MLEIYLQMLQVALNHLVVNVKGLHLLHKAKHRRTAPTFSASHNISGGTRKLGEPWLHETLYPVQHPKYTLFVFEGDCGTNMVERLGKNLE